jgi:hypothetical protein
MMLNQAKSRKRPLRTNIRQSLAKQQFEEQLRKGSVDIEKQTGSIVGHSLIPLPALEVSIAVLKHSGCHAWDDDEADIGIKWNSSFTALKWLLWLLCIFNCDVVSIELC